MRLILIVFALACFALAAMLPAHPYYPRLVAGGLALFAASFITF